MKSQRAYGFTAHRQPLRDHSNLNTEKHTPTGVFPFLNPTRHHLVHDRLAKEDNIAKKNSDRVGQSDEDDDDQQPKDDDANKDITPAAQNSPRPEKDSPVPADLVEYHWTSRSNRKGRHLLQYTPPKDAEDATKARFLVPQSTSSPREVLKVLWKMLAYYPVWNISWLVAYFFTWGSVVWVFNAFFVWLPTAYPSTEFNHEIDDGGGITAFIGATIFEIGSILLLLEAINENREGCFGWAVEQVLHNSKPVTRFTPSKVECTHHHNRHHKAYSSSSSSKNENNTTPEKSNNTVQPATSPPTTEPNTSTSNTQQWTWFPTLHQLSTHFIFQIGFLACTSQFFGATVFWISGFTALPGIYNTLSTPALKGAYYAPQIIGGSGFVISGILFMLETQKVWWKPALGTLGWHIGLWNLIGGLGFTLCPIFGLVTASWGIYQEGMSTFWGSWAFLLASVLQLYESLQTHPVEKKKPEEINNLNR